MPALKFLYNWRVLLLIVTMMVAAMLVVRNSKDNAGAGIGPGGRPAGSRGLPIGKDPDQPVREAREERPDSKTATKYAVADFAEFLRRNDRSTPAVAFVALLLRDSSEELKLDLEKRAEDPIACRMLIELSRSPTERLRWAEQLIRIDPENSLALLYKARALGELGYKEEAAGAFRASSKLGKFDNYEKAMFGSLVDTHDVLPRDAKVSFAKGGYDGFAMRSARSIYDALLPLISNGRDASGSLQQLDAVRDTLIQASNGSSRQSINAALLRERYKFLEKSEASGASAEQGPGMPSASTVKEEYQRANNEFIRQLRERHSPDISRDDANTEASRWYESWR